MKQKNRQIKLNIFELLETIKFCLYIQKLSSIEQTNENNKKSFIQNKQTFESYNLSWKSLETELNARPTKSRYNN